MGDSSEPHVDNRDLDRAISYAGVHQPERVANAREKPAVCKVVRLNLD